MPVSWESQKWCFRNGMVGVKQNTPHHKYDVAAHTVHALQNVKNDKVLRLTMLFHDMGKPVMKATDENGRDHFKGHAIASEQIAKTVMKRLKFDNDTIRKVTKLVAYHDYRMEPTGANVRRAMHEIGVELFPYYLAVRLADTKAQSSYERRGKLENIIQIRELYRNALRNKECVTLKDLAVTGTDLINLGIAPGKELGTLLNELLDMVIEDPAWNQKGKLCDYVKERFGF